MHRFLALLMEMKECKENVPGTNYFCHLESFSFLQSGSEQITFALSLTEPFKHNIVYDKMIDTKLLNFFM